VVLHYFGGMPVAEVADAMVIAEGTVKFHLHQARLALAAALEATR
jgi:DNA-directed RNA polymerase specialized sigma24 family protein